MKREREREREQRGERAGAEAPVVKDDPSLTHMKELGCLVESAMGPLASSAWVGLRLDEVVSDAHTVGSRASSASTGVMRTQGQRTAKGG